MTYNLIVQVEVKVIKVGRVNVTAYSDHLERIKSLFNRHTLVRNTEIALIDSIMLE